ncbi:aspartic proteinase CDR1-like [Durio zibethinus]|uniref:Aspartic proteinase CDR1-like n=1 Tax=Durio zibethinus TaxID=66656 RepID=A0A6P5WVR9_DURZI|nr:aspartic proteinase CDR1-like [Durio zibethinus]
MAAIVNPITLLFHVLAIVGLSCLCLIEAQKGGFSVELIHRDSLKSPLYNPLETASDRVTNALRRSFSRVHRFKPNSVSTKEAEGDIIANAGEYLLNISIGSPAFDIVAIADTGSDLIWTQCKPCSQCFQQDAPLFDPSDSSTYRTISCSASQCENLKGSSCSSDNSCQYSVTYGDKSFSNGDLSADTVTLASTTGRPVALPKTVIGCGHNNDGTFNEKTSGIIGLGGGDVSLISQLGTTIAGKFSYCLLPISQTGKSSKMNFGSNAIVSGNGVVSTPLTKKEPDTFYFLTLEAVSVGSERIKFTGSVFGSDDGNIIIDSGTTLTLVPEEFYSQLESAVSSQINATRVQGPEGLSLCYDAQTDFAVPDITVHFTNADVNLLPLNTFVLVSDAVACFTFSSNQDFAIYGNLAQMNFLVGYDTEKQTVSFKPTDCSKN